MPAMSYAGWYNIERQPGQWTFHDEPIERYRKYGMKILGTFATAPLWATSMTKAHDRVSDRYFEPNNLKAFADYVRVVSERYKGIIDTYGVWNEPFNTMFWPASYDETKHLQQKAGEHNDPWSLVDQAFAKPAAVLPAALHTDLKELAPTWRGLSPERKAFLTLLSRFRADQTAGPSPLRSRITQKAGLGSFRPRHH